MNIDKVHHELLDVKVCSTIKNVKECEQTVITFYSYSLKRNTNDVRYAEHSSTYFLLSLFRC